MEVWLLWLIATAVLIIVELLTNLVATFCLAAGCLAAMLTALCGAGIEWQLGTLAIGSVVAFIAFAPFINRLSRRKSKESQSKGKSNMDALIGRIVEVIEEIPDDGTPGRVRIDGDRWQAVCPDKCPVGSKVKVIGNDSIILQVESLI